MDEQILYGTAADHGLQWTRDMQKADRRDAAAMNWLTWLSSLPQTRYTRRDKQAIAADINGLNEETYSATQAAT